MLLSATLNAAYRGWGDGFFVRISVYLLPETDNQGKLHMLLQVGTTATYSLHIHILVLMNDAHVK